MSSNVLREFWRALIQIWESFPRRVSEGDKLGSQCKATQSISVYSVFTCVKIIYCHKFNMLAFESSSMLPLSMFTKFLPMQSERKSPLGGQIILTIISFCVREKIELSCVLDFLHPSF